MNNKVYTTVQDDSREKQITDLCGLIHNKKRAGADAFDELHNEYELKSTTKSGVSTARDVGMHTVSGWGKKYWIIAIGENLRKGFKINELYILHPSNLNKWFEHIISQINEKQRPWKNIKDSLDTKKIDKDDLEKVEYVISRGSTLNNPKIPLHYIREFGSRIELNQKKIKIEIQRFVKRYPIYRTNSV